MFVLDLAYGIWKICRTFGWRGVVLALAAIGAFPLGDWLGPAWGGGLVGGVFLVLLLEMGLNKRMD